MDSTDHRALPPDIQAILRKYYLVTTSKQAGPDGQPVEVEGYRQTNVKQADSNGQPLGPGPVLDPSVIERFLQADTTPDKAWFEWMILQAGGGKTALKRSEKLLSTTKIRFLDERVRGYRNNKSGKTFPPVSKENAQAQWDAEEANFTRNLTVGDQDLKHSHTIFGFDRHWPGKDRGYEKVALAVSKFLKLTKKTIAMNKFMKQQGTDDKIISLRPKNYETVQELESAIKKVERFYASKAARSDVRVAPGVNGEKTVYSDDYVTVLVPLTYAAAVRYGWPSWAWADLDQFEKGLEGSTQSWSDPWMSTTGRDQKLFVYIQFNVPMPSWVTMKSDRFSRHTLQNLAMVVPHAQLKNFNPDTIPLFDEENNANTTLAQIKERIRAEGQRGDQYNPEEEEEYPIYRGPRAYKDADEAEEVVRHLDAALDAVKQWAAHFNPTSVVSDYMGGSND